LFHHRHNSGNIARPPSHPAEPSPELNQDPRILSPLALYVA
jgi:hypothetical protein